MGHSDYHKAQWVENVRTTKLADVMNARMRRRLVDDPFKTMLEFCKPKGGDTMALYEVAILEKALKKDVDKGVAAEKLIHGPVAVVAKDGDAAKLKVALECGKKVESDRMVVLVRPFV